MANRFLSNIRINDAYTLPASDGTTGQVIVTDGSGNLSFADQSGGGTETAAVIKRDNFIGDGTTVAFTLANSLSDEDQSQVYIDGVYQSKDTYEVSGNVLTFATAPETGHSVEVISIYGINSGPTVLYQDNFVGDGTTTDFTFAQLVNEEIKTFVFLNGVYQFKGTYNIDGDTISFDSAPVNGTQIEVITLGSVFGETSNQSLLFYGKATEAFSKGDAIMFAGVEGDHFLLAKATQAALAANHEYFLGLATQSLSIGEFGYVTEFGRVDSIDTTVWTAGDILWFDSEGTTAGALTNTEPTPPNTKIQIAAVIREHQNEGVLFVRPTIYHELGELHDVNITSVADKDMLVWDSASGYWENTKTLGDITTGNITTSGTVDSVDLSAFKSDYDTKSVNWDTAYSWGDHSGLYSLVNHTHVESDITNFGNYVTSVTHDTVNTKLVVTNRDATTTDLSLVQYLDDTNLARLVSGSLDSGTFIATFTRDDATTFTVDFSSLLQNYTAGSGLTLTGTEFSHSDTSSAADLTASSRTYVTGLTFDTFGHVTGYTTGTETVVDTNTTYSAGSGLVLSGTTFSHADTSSAANLAASGRRYVTGLTFDTYGHVTGYTTGTETVVDTNTTYSAGSGLTLSGTTFSLQSDLRGEAWLIGRDNNDYINVDTTVIDFALDGAIDMRLYNNGDLHVEGNVIGYSTSISDQKFKDDVTPIESALDKVKALKGVEYTWNATSKKGKRDLGFIAQEVEQIIPELVTEHTLSTGEFADNPTQSKTIDYEKITAVLVEAVKEQQKQIELLTTHVGVLKAKINGITK